MYKVRFQLFIIFTLVWSAVTEAELIVTHRSPYTPMDKHNDYSNALIALALEKTRPQFGGFQLKALPPRNYARSLKTLADNSYPNLVMETSYEAGLTEKGNLTYINFPIDLGVLGYRVCFVSPQIKASGERFSSLQQLKKYTFAHGVGWADTRIFRHNGLKVREIENYDGIFLMVLGGRVDFFCRGANEILSEVEQFKELTDLVIDDSFVLVYPLPRLLYLNSKNLAAKNRLEAGIRMAYADGSLQQLWLKHFKASLDFVSLNKRNVIYLDNPLLNGLNLSIQPNFMSLLEDRNEDLVGESDK
jgi:hypothetical protein